jgi:hypothetical protein
MNYFVLNCVTAFSGSMAENCLTGTKCPKVLTAEPDASTSNNPEQISRSDIEVVTTETGYKTEKSPPLC